MKQTTTDRTFAALRHVFSSHGIPVQIVSDNGPQFTSSDFAKFLKQNGIKHSRTSPYHPDSNGEAERFVRTFKEAMKAGRNDGLILSHRLSSFLLSYRTTPHSTTGVPPCELLMERHLRTRFDLLKPDLQRTVRNHQTRQKARHDRSARLRQFNTGQSVMVRNFGSGANWIAGVIVRQEGPVTYLVEVSDGRLWKRHVDHVKECHFTPISMLMSRQHPTQLIQVTWKLNLTHLLIKFRVTRVLPHLCHLKVRSFLPSQILLPLVITRPVRTDRQNVSTSKLGKGGVYYLIVLNYATLIIC